MPSTERDPASPSSEKPAQAMSDEAFEALFRAHFDFVYRNLARLGVPPGAVEDAAQEVFVVVLRRGESVESMRGWIFGIVRRIAWRYRRGSARRVRLEHALTVTAPPPTDGTAAVAEREAKALLEGFLGSLGEDKRVVFLLAELEQMTGPEIAEALGVNENTVYSRLRAARQAFDRTFSRLRRAERRALGEGPHDDRSLRLSRARRAHEPKPVTRQRAWIALFGAPGGAAPGAASGGAIVGAGAQGGGGPGSTIGAASGGAPAASVVPAKGGLMGFAGLAGSGGAKVIWGAALALVSVVAVASTVPLDEAPSSPLTGARSEEEPSIGSSSLSAVEGAPVAELGADATLEPPAELGSAVIADAEGTARGPFAALARANARREKPPQGLGASGLRRGSGSGVVTEPAKGRRPASGWSPTTDLEGDADEFSDGAAEATARGVDGDALGREVEMMSRARAEIRARSWARAKMMLERHARHFPEGTLAEERRLSLVSVLCAMGDVAAARAEVQRIKALDPEGPAVEKAVSICPGVS